MAGIASLQNENRISKREAAEAQGESFRRERLANLRDTGVRTAGSFFRWRLFFGNRRMGLLGFGKFHKRVSSQVRKSGAASR